ncbi:hypothetical protein [Sphingobium fuliginis]|jgi:hypothetical protein|nr:hypothetical protein [Sphingobium fuliginis]
MIHTAAIRARLIPTSTQSVDLIHVDALEIKFDFKGLLPEI